MDGATTGCLPTKQRTPVDPTDPLIDELAAMNLAAADLPRRAFGLPPKSGTDSLSLLIGMQEALARRSKKP